MSAASLVSWVLETGLAISALIVLILLIRRPVARYFGAGAAYALWALPFMRLFMPEITLPTFFAREGQDSLGSFPTVTVAPFESYAPFLPPAETIMSPVQSLGPGFMVNGLLIIWGLGAIIWFSYNLMCQRRFIRRLLNNTQLPSQQYITEYVEPAYLAANLKTQPIVRIASDDSGPLVTGLWQPIVVLPSGFIQDLTVRQQHFALLHEFTHIRRGDLWVAFAWLLFRAVNWPNPLVHMAARHFRADQEAACDASVLAQIGDTPESRHSYGETLLCSVKMIRSSEAEPRFGQPLELALNHSLKERLMVLKSTQAVSRPMARLWAAGLITCGLVLSAPYTFADGTPDDKASELAGAEETKAKKVIRKRKIIKGEGDVEKEERIEVKVIDGHMTIMRLDPETGEMKVVQKEDLSDLEDLGVDLDFDDMHFNDMIIEKDVEIIKELEGEEAYHWKNEGGKRKIIIRSEGDKNAHTEKHFVFKGHPHGHEIGIQAELEAAAGLLEAAEGMIGQAEERGYDTEDTTRFRKAQRKLEKARKALKEAQAELAKE